MKVVVLWLGLAAVLCAGAAKQAKVNELPREMKADDASHIPSLENPQDEKELECSACLSAGLELLGSLRNLRKEFQYEPHKLKEYHLLSAAEDLCDDKVLEMGLLQGADKRVSTTYGNELAPSVKGRYQVIKGGWVTHHWRRVCHETMDRIEDDLMSVYKSGGANYRFCPMCTSIGKQATLADEL
jgi:hypothetical protein